MTTIAFIGLGNMGSPMAANLVKAGARGQRLRPRAGLLRAGQGRGRRSMAGSARDAVADAEVVITMLPAGKHVLSV